MGDIASVELASSNQEQVRITRAEQHPLQEVLSADSRIIMSYVHHANTVEERMFQLADIVRGNYLRTGWNTGFIGGIASARAIGKDRDSRSLGNATLFATDGASPLSDELKSFQDFLAIVHNPNNEAGRAIKGLFAEKNIPEQAMDRLLEAIEVHWGHLPFNPQFTKNSELLLLRGDSYEIPNIPDKFTQELIAKPDQLNEVQQEEKYHDIARVVTLSSGAVVIASLVANLIDSRQNKQRPKLSRRRFLKGATALFGVLTLASGREWKLAADKLEAFDKATTEVDSKKAEQAVERFDAAMQTALKSAKPEDHNVFRTLLLLAKTEEALQRTDLGLTTDDLAAIIMGRAHLWDRQYTAEMRDPQKRAQFIKNHVQMVLIPTLDTALSYSPGQISRDQAIQDLITYIATVDITRFKAPDRDRFPMSLLDQGVITPVASYQNQSLLKVLKS